MVMWLYVEPSPLLQGLSLVNTGPMITSQAYHWSQHQGSKLSESTHQFFCGCTTCEPWCTLNWTQLFLIFFPSFVSILLAAHAKRFSVFWIEIGFKLYCSLDRIICITALLYRTNIVLETSETAIPTFRFTFCSGIHISQGKVSCSSVILAISRQKEYCFWYDEIWSSQTKNMPESSVWGWYPSSGFGYDGVGDSFESCSSVKVESK